MLIIALRVFIVLLAMIGLLGAGNISIEHWLGHEQCPTIGTLPACYVVFVGYLLIATSMLPALKHPIIVFMLGWLPVFILALTGLVGELTGFVQCPHLENGFPKCYLSATISSSVGIIAYYVFSHKKRL